jgi:hypothetical protein
MHAVGFTAVSASGAPIKLPPGHRRHDGEDPDAESDFRVIAISHG